jgi:hypothetical protein
VGKPDTLVDALEHRSALPAQTRRLLETLEDADGMGSRGIHRRIVLRHLLTAIILGAVGLTATGCEAAQSSAEPSVTPSAPPGGAPIATWSISGGYADAGLSALRPPKLVMYAGGEVIADAAYRISLDTATLTELLGKLIADLKAPPTGRPSGSVAQMADVPTTALKVWNGTTFIEMTAVGLDEHRDDNTYPDSVYDARDRLGALHRKVAATAQPYLADRVRVVASDARPDAVDVRPWPDGMAIPTVTGPDNTRLVDLDGEAAREAVRLLTRDLDQRGAWPTYRTIDGRELRASWRYLLPDE